MKRVLQIAGGLVALVILALVVITLVIDPNDYKPQIQAQVKKNLNRELVIQGDIGWSLLPTFGIELGPVQLKNPPGFNRDNLVEIQQSSVAIDILPLLTGKVQVGMVELRGFHVNLITQADGTSNLDGLTESKPAPATDTPASQGDKGALPLTDLTIGGLLIADTRLEMQDLGTGETTRLVVEEVSLGRLVLGEDTPLHVSAEIDVADLRGALKLDAEVNIAQALSAVALKQIKLTTTLNGESLPKPEINIGLMADLAFDMATQAVSLENLKFNADDIELAGKLSAKLGDIPQARFTLAGNTWDLEPWMPAGEVTEEAAPVEEAPPATEPDLSFLKSLDVEGELTIEGIKASGLTITDAVLKLDVGDGKLVVAPMSAKLYEGELKVNATVDEAGGKNRYEINKTLAGVKILPLLKDLAGQEVLSGSTAMSVAVKGAGLTPEKIKAGMAGQGNFEFVDGALYGINIPQKIRGIKAMFSGEKVEEQNGIQKTDFTSLKGEFSIADGKVDNNLLNMMTPMLRMDGKGIANLLEENVDYRLNVAVVGSLEGQGGEPDKDLAGLNLPLAITGPWADPKFRLDSDSALKAKVDQEKDKLKEKAKDKLKEKLGNLFGN